MKRIWFGIAIVWLLWRGAAPLLSRDFVVTFFDVGQGDAALIEFPHGERWLIDGGGGFGDYSMGDRVLLPQLQRRLRFTVHRVIASHFDQDHIYGIFPVLQKLNVRSLVIGSDENASKSHLGSLLLKLAQVSHVPVLYRGQGESERVSGVDVRWWRTSVALRKSNKRSLVTEFRFNDCGVLFTGDIEADVEREMSVGWALPVSLLKVPHHGSKTSSTGELLNAIRPRWAIGSMGQNNFYGHPHREVVSAYRSREISLLRTDFHGFVQFRFTDSGWAFCRSSHGPCGSSRCDREKRARAGTR